MATCQPVGDAGAKLEHNRRRALAQCPNPQTRRRKRAARGNRHRQQCRGAAARIGTVIDEPREAPARAAFRCGREIGFARVTVLNVRKFVAERGEYLHQHDAGIGRNTFTPLRPVLGREIEQRVVEAGEVAREIVDARLGHVLFRALACRLAIEVGRAALLERERDVVEPAIDTRIVDRQPVDREITRLGDFDFENRARSGRRRLRFPCLPDDVRRNDGLAARSADDADEPRSGAGRHRRGRHHRRRERVRIDQEKDLQDMLVVWIDHLHKIDAGDPRRRGLLA